jgi:hypothetical protein
VSLPDFPPPPAAAEAACAAPFACPRIGARAMPGRTCASRHADAGTNLAYRPCAGCPAGAVRLRVLGPPAAARGNWTTGAASRRNPEAPPPSTDRPARRGRKPVEWASPLSAAGATTATTPAQAATTPRAPAAGGADNDCNGEVSMGRTKGAAAQPDGGHALPGDCDRCKRPRWFKYTPPTDERAEFCGRCIDTAKTQLRAKGKARTPANIIEYLRTAPTLAQMNGERRRTAEARRQDAPIAAALDGAEAPAGLPPHDARYPLSVLDEVGPVVLTGPNVEEPVRVTLPPAVVGCDVPAAAPLSAADAAKLAEEAAEHARAAAETERQIADLDQRRAALVADLDARRTWALEKLAAAQAAMGVRCG